MFEAIRELIEKYDSIIINGHANPDGDCYGSQIAFREILKLAYPDKRVFAVGQGMKRFIPLLGQMDKVDDDTFKESLIVILDGNDLSRMEDKRVFTGKAFLKIDHHIDTNTFKEGLQVVDADASSTCEIVTEIVEKIGWEINKIAANALYLGILTDTGRFQFANDFTKLFNQASWLCFKGAAPREIYRILNVTDEIQFKVKSLFFSRYKKTKAGTIYVILRYDDIKEYGYSSVEVANMINVVGNIENCPIWASFVEAGDGRVKVELRSNNPSVQPLTVKYGGGGHRKAAGMTLPTFDEKQIYHIIDELDDIIVNYNGGK